MFRYASFLFLLALSSVPAGAKPPHVVISYDETLDAKCASEHGSEIKAEWKAELVHVRSEFESQWAAVGPKFIAATEHVTGKHFSQRSLNVRLTLCNVPSEDSRSGILVNMRYALKSFVEEPVPVRYKVAVLFHEALHSFLSDNPIKASQLLLGKRPVNPTLPRG